MYDASLAGNRPKNIHLPDRFNAARITSNALVSEPEAAKSSPVRGIVLAVALSLLCCWIPLVLFLTWLL